MSTSSFILLAALVLMTLHINGNCIHGNCIHGIALLCPSLLLFLQDVLLKYQIRVGELFKRIMDQTSGSAEDEPVSTSELESQEYSIQDYDSYSNTTSLMEALS